MRPRGTLALATVVAAFALALGLASTGRAAESGFKVIVHPENPVTSVDREFLRNAFLKKASGWSTGETIRPVDLASRYPARDQFTHQILRKTPAQLRSYWNQQIFSGKGVPPPEATTPRQAIEYVLAHPGAVGYLPADVDPRGAKVIEVR